MNGSRKRTAIAIVGASCRAAAQRAALAGWSPLAADQFLDRDLRECAEVFPIEDIDAVAVQWSLRFSALPLLLCGGMENQPEIIDRLQAYGLRCGCDGRTVRMLRDPERWAAWCDASGVRWPRVLNPEAAGAGPRSEGGWLVKATDRAAGMGVGFWDGQGTLAPGAYVQEFVVGDSLGVTFLSDTTKSHVMGAAQSWKASDFPAPGAFWYRGSFGPIPLQAEECQRLVRFAEIVRAATGIRGLWQADFLRNAEGWWLLEINPRWSASMELLDAGLAMRLVPLHAAAIAGEPIAIDPSRASPVAIGRCILYASELASPAPSVWQRWWDRRWRGAVSELESDVRLADIPATYEPIPEGYPILSCFAADRDERRMHTRLRDAVEKILATLPR